MYDQKKRVTRKIISSRKKIFQEDLMRILLREGVSFKKMKILMAIEMPVAKRIVSVVKGRIFIIPKTKTA